MSNRVKVSATFSFRGQTHHPSMTVDLDDFLARHRDLDELYPLLAAANGIGPYSYEYEVLEMAPLTFSEPEGLVADYLDGDRLDLEGLRRAIAEEGVRRQLTELARRHLAVEELDALPGLEEALRAAWRLGRKSASEIS